MRIVFMGTPDFAVPSLEGLIEAGYDVIGVVTQPDRPKGRKKVLTPPPVKEAALRLGIPVLQPEKLKNSTELERLLAWQPDLIVTAAFGQLLPTEVLELPRHGCLNVHASLLPKYRGGAPIHQAIIDGEEESGVTIMYMVEKLDAGDIISQVRVPITDEDNVATMFHKLSLAGATLLIKTLPKLLAGEIQPVKQNEAEVSYAFNIKREDEEIIWSNPARTVFNQIRGLSPFPGAFTTINGEVLKVWAAILSGQKQVTSSPGTILRLEEQEGIVVVAGDGQAVALTEIQPAGKKKMSSSDFIRGAGASWQPGMKLGE